MRNIILFFCFFCSVLTLKSQHILSASVLDINCYQTGEIHTKISSLDTNVFSKWYYSEDASTWLLLDTTFSQIVFNKSNFNSDSLTTSICGYYKLRIVNILDTVLEEDEYYVSCQLSAETSLDIIKCKDDLGAIYIDSVIGGSPPYNFSWFYNNSYFSGNITYLDSLYSGLYIVVVTDSLSCQDTIYNNLINPEEFVLDTIIINNLGCFEDSSGSIFISVSGGRKISTGHKYNYYLLHNNDTISEFSVGNITQNVQYHSTSLSTSPFISDSITITNLFSDSFRLIIIDSTACILDTLVFVNQPESFVLFPETNLPVELCSSDTSWFVIDSISGGNFPFNYSIYDSDTIITYSSVLNDSIYLPSGEYYIYVYDTINNCQDTLYFSINSLYDINADIIVDNILCYGDSSGSILIDSVYGGVPPYYYNWNNILIQNLSEGYYLCEIIDSFSCIFRDSFFVSQSDDFNIISNIIHPLCSGDSSGSVFLDVTGNPPFQIAWSNGDVGDTLNSLSAGSYIFTIIDINNCTYSDTILLLDPDPLTIDFINYDDSLWCFGDSTEIEVSVLGYDSSFSVFWSNNTTLINTNIYAGVTYCIVTDNNNCVVTDSICIYQPDPFVLTDIVIIDTVCNDGVIANTEISGGRFPIQYLWNTGDLTQNILINDSINYISVVAEDACGQIDSSNLYITPFVLETSVVYDDSSRLAFINIDNASNGGPFDYLWSNLREDSLFLDSFLYVNPCEKTYYITTINSINGCFVIDTLNLTSYLPDSLIDLSNTSVIPDSSLWGFGPYTYFWSTGNITQNVEICPGQYWVEVRDNSYGVNGEGCMLRQDFSIDKFSINLEPSGLIIECDLSNTDVIVEAVVTGGTPGYNYSWSIGSTNNPLEVSLIPGTYNLEVIDKNNCKTDTNFIVQPISVDCVPNIFTPNGDQINDTWNLEDIFLFDDSEVKIFGRFGKLLFRSQGYKEPWDGTSISGNEVPEGVYFYIINLQHGFGVIEGTVTIIR